MRAGHRMYQDMRAMELIRTCKDGTRIMLMLDNDHAREVTIKDIDLSKSGKEFDCVYVEEM